MKKIFISTSILMLFTSATFAAAGEYLVGGNTDGSNYDGDIVLDATGAYKIIVGGNQRANAPTGNVNGNITLNLNNIEVTETGGFVGGGNLLNYINNPADNPNAHGSVTGKITINFNSGVIGSTENDVQGLYGGNTGGNSYQNDTVGSVEINFNGGNLINTYASGTGAGPSSVRGDVVINVTKGNVEMIIGANGGASIGGKVVMNVSGGTVGDIYAGGQGNASVIGGSTNIILSGDAVVTGDVYAGSWYSERGGTIKGGTNITISDNATVAGSINGAGLSGSGTIEGAKTLNISNYTGSETLNVSNFSELSVNDTTSITLNGVLELDNLAIDKNSSLSLSAGSSIDSYTLVFADSLKEGEDLSLDGFKDIKIGEETIVLSSLLDDENNISSFTVMDASGQEFKLALDENKQFVVGTAVPEPSTYAVIFGAIALGFVMYRRR